MVSAELDDSEVSCYHAACFCCATCWELLVDLTYFQYGNKVYCARHHAELSRQRCYGCDEVRLPATICYVVLWSSSFMGIACDIAKSWVVIIRANGGVVYQSNVLSSVLSSLMPLLSMPSVAR